MGARKAECHVPSGLRSNRRQARWARRHEALYLPPMEPPSADQLEQHRAALTGHCYRMLGSAFEADDAVQETMVRAWRALQGFDGRASLRTWLYKIATNVCLDALGAPSRRMRPLEYRPAGTVHDDLEALPRSHWLEPVPDVAVLPAHADPAERLALRQSIRLAFVAALQHLPPRQRAALLLAEVLGCSAAEVADCLDMTVPAVNSALQRARATLASRDLHEAPAELSAPQVDLVERFVSAFERYDMEALTTLLRQDATMNMPPFALWLRGHEAIRAWLLGRGAACRGSRLRPSAACGSPTFAQYKPDGQGGHGAWALVVLELEANAITGMTFFLDVEVLFPRFGLPLRLPA